MATPTVFVKFGQILATVWQGVCHFLILRHFANLASFAMSFFNFEALHNRLWVTLCQWKIAFCYHLFNVIIFSWLQSDYIKRHPL